jgi:muconolactone delta-isomerase
VNRLSSDAPISPEWHHRGGNRIPVSVGGRKEDGRMQYLVTMDFVDPGPLLPIQQYVGMMRQAVLPGHEALQTLKSEGKILAGGFPVGERAIAFIVESDSPKELDALLQFIPFWGIVKTKVTPLQDFEDRHDQDRQGTEQMEQSLQQ